jgi:hypothetical protein
MDAEGYYPGFKYDEKNAYKIINNTWALVKLTQGQCMMIDIDDLSLLREFCVCAAYHKSISGYYAKTTVGKQSICFHRLLMGVLDQDVSVDHINGDTLDNRRINLRIVTNQINSRNRRVNRNNLSTGIKGIQLYGGSYVASIYNNAGKKIWKCFCINKYSSAKEALEEAIKWRRDKEIEFGNYLNTH